MMHDTTHNAIVRDIQLAQGVFGEASVFWPPSLSWVKICNYLLPTFFNRSSTDLLIIPPPHYGLVNVPLSEFYMDQDLLVRTNKGWQSMPHYHTVIHNKYGDQGWSWYCIHPQGWSKKDSLLTFLKLVDLMLQDPLNWTS